MWPLHCMCMSTPPMKTTLIFLPRRQFLLVLNNVSIDVVALSDKGLSRLPARQHSHDNIRRIHTPLPSALSNTRSIITHMNQYTDNQLPQGTPSYHAGSCTAFNLSSCTDHPSSHPMTGTPEVGRSASKPPFHLITGLKQASRSLHVVRQTNECREGRL